MKPGTKHSRALFTPPGRPTNHYISTNPSTNPTGISLVNRQPPSTTQIPVHISYSTLPSHSHVPFVTLLHCLVAGLLRTVFRMYTHLPVALVCRRKRDTWAWKSLGYMFVDVSFFFFFVPILYFSYLFVRSCHERS
jgi:hypothetical protein